jgi:hypothetical protein
MTKNMKKNMTKTGKKLQNLEDDVEMLTRILLSEFQIRLSDQQFEDRLNYPKMNNKDKLRYNKEMKSMIMDTIIENSGKFVDPLYSPEELIEKARRIRSRIMDSNPLFPFLKIIPIRKCSCGERNGKFKGIYATELPKVCDKCREPICSTECLKNHKCKL